MDKKTVVLCLVLVMCGGNIRAVGFLGPPTAELKQGQWSAGIDYSYSKQDLDKTNVKWTWYANGVFNESGTTRTKVEDFARNLYYANVGYGVTDAWHVYGKLGVADVKEEIDPGTDLRYFEDGKVGVNFDNDFAWSWGTRYTFARKKSSGWGVALQMNWLDASWNQTDKDATETWKQSVDIDAFDLLLAVGPTLNMGCCKVYGGPLYYYLSGDVEATYKTLATTGTLWSGNASGDLEADGNFGGYIGAQLDLKQNWNMAVEFSFIDGWGLGVGILHRF